MGEYLAEVLGNLNERFQAEKITAAALCNSLGHIMEGLQEQRTPTRLSGVHN